MMEIIGKTTISEVILLFLLLFVLPVTALLVLRLRQYEKLYGVLVPEGKSGKKAKKKAETEVEKEAPAAKGESSDGYAYRARVFLSPAERTCLRVMREVLGKDVDVYPKVALWETVEPMDPTQANINRLHGQDYDFLVCDQKTGQPLTAVMFKGGRGGRGGAAGELTKICEAAGASVIFIDMAEEYDAAKMKQALRIPDLELD